MSCSDNQSTECLESVLSSAGLADYRAISLSIIVGISVVFALFVYKFIQDGIGKDQIDIAKAFKQSVFAIGFVMTFLILLPMII
ncbi:hypothetical protein VAS14_00181 [Vibrio angustum S14]|uniref:Uncharacterized protein n=1 Tax=Photobacterium angustum (strain S14 / CCUG 15956) TaxID=314292 RepID=Q1ZJT3_PHOAS|nr:hypothetical protein [Photobacterium angustum]EAS62439.1 hypothetical protein VAS14_00181 [Vibrio angustum S14] [Photobacterium angustum S14]